MCVESVVRDGAAANLRPALADSLMLRGPASCNARSGVGAGAALSVTREMNTAPLLNTHCHEYNHCDGPTCCDFASLQSRTAASEAPRSSATARSEGDAGFP